MKSNPVLMVENGSHISSLGTRKYNDWLAQRRANRTVNYIISKGIESW